MNKKWNIVYYIFTILLSLSYLFASYTELTRWPEGVELMKHLGYPVYFLTIIGVAKFLGVIGIWQKFCHTLREWAYAGIAFNLIGAIVSHMAVGDGLQGYGPALANLIIAAVSYIALKKRMGAPIMS